MEESPLNAPSGEPAARRGSAGASQPADEGSLSIVLRRAFRDSLKWTIPLGIVLALLVFIAVWFFTEPKYRSHSTLRIAETQPHLAYPAPEVAPAFAQTQVELLRSPFIISRAIDAAALKELPELKQLADQEDGVAWIRESLKVIHLESLTATVVLLREKIDSMRQVERGSRDVTLELRFAREDLRFLEDVHRRIAERVAQLTIEGRAQSRVRVIETGTLPEFPEGPTVVGNLRSPGRSPS